MEDKTLIQYGNLNLSKSYIITSDDEGERSHFQNIQRLQNSRTPGSTPVSRNLLEKNIILSGSIVANTSKSVQDILNEMNRSLSDGDRYLRLIRKWVKVLEPNSSLVWTPSGDGCSAENDTIEAWFETSLKFSINTALSASDYAEYSTTNNTGSDLEEFSNTGNFEIGVYIPDPTSITSVSFKIGSDISNYISSGDITKQFDDQPIKEGWNWFSIAWNRTTMSGTVDPGAIGKYVSFRINYAAAQANMSSVRFAGLIWHDDEKAKNYRCYSASLKPEDLSYEKGFTNFELEFLAYKGYGESTTEKIAYSGVGSATPTNITVALDGNEAPEPTIELKMTNITNLDTMVLQNITTGDQVIIDPAAWAANDNISINMETKSVTQNNNPIDYISVLPRFVVGNNKLSFSETSTSQDVQQQATNNTDLSGEI